MLHAPYGLQRELLGRAGTDHQGCPRFHDFPKAWAAYELTGRVDRQALEDALASVFDAADVFRQTIAGARAGGRTVDPPRHPCFAADSTEAAERRFRSAILPLLFDPGDLAAGARPFSLTVHAPGRTLLALGADHAFLDGYSLSVLLRAVTRDYQCRVRNEEPAPLPPGIPVLAARFRNPSERTDLARHFAACPQPATSLSLPGTRELPPEHWEAHDTHQFLVTAADAGGLRAWCARRSVAVSAAWRALVQFTASVWRRDEEPVPVLYARLGRTGTDALRAVGPFYESVVSLPGPRLSGDFDTWAGQGAEPGIEAPPLLGAWLSDFTGQRRLDLYRLVSFNYLPLPRPVRLDDATAAPVGGPLLAGLQPRPPQRLEKRNGVHAVVYRLTAGRFLVQVRADPRIAGTAKGFGQALRQALLLMGEGAPVSVVRRSVADAWG
ncbi:hypothetical protein AB0L59_12370 [Streptomyces sp. NPDC052109]|uniref:hypothetical protein n=1 Tax=Streptomyces sp. NPDC052109 TaxID=3155527 RepID=UPI003449BE1A